MSEWQEAAQDSEKLITALNRLADQCPYPGIVPHIHSAAFYQGLMVESLRSEPSSFEAMTLRRAAEVGVDFHMGTYDPPGKQMQGSLQDLPALLRRWLHRRPR